MIHPMYKIPDFYLEKFPLVASAIEATASDLEGALFWLFGEAHLTALPLRLIETVDQGVDASDAEKQALIIGALYALAPAALRIDETELAERYDGETEKVLNEFMMRDPDAVQTTRVSRLGIALNIIMINPLAARIQQGKAAIPPGLIESTQRDAQGVRARLFPNLDAPGLQMRFLEAEATLFAAVKAANLRSGKRGPDAPQP